jgi:hypothetical protein
MTLAARLPTMTDQDCAPVAASRMFTVSWAQIDERLVQARYVRLANELDRDLLP